MASTTCGARAHVLSVQFGAGAAEHGTRSLKWAHGGWSRMHACTFSGVWLVAAIGEQREGAWDWWCCGQGVGVACARLHWSRAVRARRAASQSAKTGSARAVACEGALGYPLHSRGLRIQGKIRCSVCMYFVCVPRKPGLSQSRRLKGRTTTSRLRERSAARRAEQSREE
jgi:hypothetical protein